MKFALVKQKGYNDLYSCPPATSDMKLPLQSKFRTGPAALFIRHDTDFYITNDTSPFDSLLGVDHNEEAAQLNSEYAINSEDVDWSMYDCVITTDIAVKPETVKKYPDVLWAYYLTDPSRMPEIVGYDKPIDGYDIHLNLNISTKPSNGCHFEINFPYLLHYFGCFRDIGVSIRRSNIFTSYYTSHHDRQYLLDQGISKDLKGFVHRKGDGDIMNVIVNLSKSKYFIKYGPRGVWGNATIEAIACGCLAFSQRLGNGASDLVGENCLTDDYDELIYKVKHFEENDKLYEEQLEIQRYALDEFCYHTPMETLTRKILEKQNG